MSRDDDTEPKTRILGTIARTPHRDDPHGQLANEEQTRLEIAGHKLAAVEPATKIMDPSTFRRTLSLAATLRSTPQTSPHDEITVLRPRLSIGSHDELPAPRPRRRTIPFALAILLAVLCLATAASLLGPRARGPKLAAARPAATQPAQAPTSQVERFPVQVKTSSDQGAANLHEAKRKPNPETAPEPQAHVPERLD